MATCVFENTNTGEKIEFTGVKEGDVSTEGPIGPLMAEVQSLRVQINQHLTDMLEKEKALTTEQPAMKKKKDEEGDGENEEELSDGN